MPSERDILRNAPQRLRAIADALESGQGLTWVAAKFRVPKRALHRVVTPKRNQSRPSKVISLATLEAAAALVREGKTVKKASMLLAVPLSSLMGQMLKHGLSVKNIRPPDSKREERLEQAVSQYRAGVIVSEISRTSGIPERTLYTRFRRLGISMRQPRTTKPASS